MRASNASGTASNHTATRGAHSTVTGQGGNNLIYNLPQHFNCQSMSSLTSDCDTHRFLIGTCTLHKPNEIHLVTFNEDANRVDLQRVFRGDPDGSGFTIDEVADLRACPYQSQRGLFACSHQGQVSVFNMPEDVFDEIGEDGDGEEARDVDGQEGLTEVCKLSVGKGDGDSEKLVSVQWEDAEAKDDKVGKELIACDSQRVYLWDIAGTKSKKGVPRDIIKCADYSCDLITASSSPSTCRSVKRDPHNSNVFAFTYGKRFEIVDVRQGSKSRVIQDSNCLHSSQQLLDLDYNPIKLHTLASAGQDSTVRFWDLRKIDSGECILAYNPTLSQTSSLLNPGGQKSKGAAGAFSGSVARSSATSRGNSTVVGMSTSNTIAQQFQSHWITKLKFNLSHDQLLLTSDTATFINLYKFQSVSSAPAG